MNNKIHIGVITEHRARNYGSVLQNYALIKVLNEITDAKVNTIDYRPYFIENSFGVFNRELFHEAVRSPKKLLRFLMVTIYKMPVNIVRENKFKRFREHRLCLSESYYNTFPELDQAIDSYDCVFIGSDQVWNTDITDGFCPGYFGDFANYHGILASYAASIGKKEVDLEKFKEKLDNFDMISVRESSAKNQLKELTDKEIEVVLDPTLLVEKKVWLELLDENYLNEEYIFVYLLEINDEIVRLVNEFAKKKKMPIVFFDVKKRYNCKCYSRYNAGPEEFLTYLYHSKYVITNSFHGTVFSIIFEKQFISIPHTTKSSRAIDLLNKLGLSSQIYDPAIGVSVIDSSIDFGGANEVINESRKESMDYIDRVISMVKCKKDE